MSGFGFINVLFSFVSSSGASIISVGGAVAAWFPFYVKKPQLSMCISVKALSYSSTMGGMNSVSNAWHLVSLP
jgi:hypothetical protein